MEILIGVVAAILVVAVILFLRSVQDEDESSYYEVDPTLPLRDENSFINRDGLTIVGNDPNGVNLTLVSTGPKKINVIKIIRQYTNLGLKEAKDAADNPPTMLFRSVSSSFANSVKSELELAGATVQVEDASLKI